MIDTQPHDRVDAAPGASVEASKRDVSEPVNKEGQGQDGTVPAAQASQQPESRTDQPQAAQSAPMASTTDIAPAQPAPVSSDANANAKAMATTEVVWHDHS